MSRNNEPSDASLVVQVLAGDREAFGCLYDRYAHLVRAVVYRADNEPPLVNDLTQECFLRAYRNLAAPETARSVRGLGGGHCSRGGSRAPAFLAA